ncbi:polysaccharide pyruvyl transferase family protein [Paraburkholderia fungorum]|uniref:polysaccharide pyruvyl transferase family protein n=1 Tax=Paraburkholderia fungorum TaxID=134537 RepID=UPI0038783CA0
MKNHEALMFGLKNCHREIFNLLEGKRFHYIDIPVHNNIGDLLILQGAMKCFCDFRLSPITISSARCFKPEWVRENDVLVFHGGGNFGDIYEDIDGLRESIMRRFKNNRIVMMPQTIFFNRLENQIRSARAWRECVDFHLFVRDQVSYDAAKHFSDHIYLVPDMAHHLYPFKRKGKVNSSSLRIQRVDAEKRKTPGALKGMKIDETTDWIDVVGFRNKWVRFTWILESFAIRYNIDWMLRMVGPLIWMPISKYLSKQAVKTFSNHGHVITDRLHGHILACLMDIPNTVIDNSYGKNSTYMKEWTVDSEIVSLIGED